MADDSLSVTLTSLSSQATQLMDKIERIGASIPHGSAVGDAILSLFDIVLDMDSTIDETQRAVAFLGRKETRPRRLNNEEKEELLQARRDRRQWEQEKQAMERKIATSELRIKSLQELNSMLLERGRASTPSSGFSSANHSPRSIEEKEEEASASSAAEAPVQREEPPVVVAPPKPERKHSAKVLTLNFTPEYGSTTFKDSLQLHKERQQKTPKCADLNKKATKEDLDGTIQLSFSPEAPNEGPLCSTFREEISVYHTPSTSQKKMRRRSSSLGDVMKKIFTPKSKHVKNPILEIIDD